MIPLFLALLAAAPETIRLPPPAGGAAPLAQALQARRSEREFSPKSLSLEALSGLLWSAYGVNRPASGGRTAPSAHNWQTIDVFAVLEQGIYLYEPAAHRLKLVAEGDHRALAGGQDFVRNAPVTLVLVARMDKTKKSAADSDEDVLSWVSIEAGAISQNAALYCAAQGLNSVLHVGVNRPAFAKAARLAAGAKIILAHSAGHPPR